MGGYFIATHLYYFLGCLDVPLFPLPPPEPSLRGLPPQLPLFFPFGILHLLKL